MISKESTFIEGRLTKGLGGLYVILGEDGRTYTARGKGSLKREVGKLQIGDKVEVKLEAEEKGEVVISRVLPRKNSLIRPPIANLDWFFLVIAVTSPDPSLETADKMLAICEHNRILPAVIISKTDYDPEGAEKLRMIYEKAGFPALSVSSSTGEGLEEVRNLVKDCLSQGKIGAFAGASGVGKSTLLNHLYPELKQETGDISVKTQRGKHTTRSVELLPLPDGDGFLADTPGFSLLDFERFDFFTLEELPYCFREFLPYLGKCRYNDCTHVKEEDCAVRQAVRDGIIPESRHQSYASLFTVLKEKEANLYK